MLWDTIMGQPEVVSQLKAAIANNTLSHAYLFVGPRGLGKRTTAKILASALNCQQGACGNCHVCCKIAHETHPDVVLVEPEGNYLTVGQIRTLREAAGLKAFEGETRVYIIDEVDRMTSAAANALLKILEEPPGRLIFILITANFEGVLPTIVSRCQLIRFKTIPAPQMMEFLVQNYRLNPKQAALTARISGGVLGSAVVLASSREHFERRGAIINLILEIQKADALKIFEITDEIIARIKNPLPEIEEKQKTELREMQEVAINKSHLAFIKRRYEQKHKRELNRQEQQGFEEVLSIFASWYRDLMVLKETASEDLLVNIDQTDKLKGSVGRLSPERIQEAINIIEKTRERLSYNVNVQLAFEGMLFELQEVSG